MVRVWQQTGGTHEAGYVRRGDTAAREDGTSVYWAVWARAVEDMCEVGEEAAAVGARQCAELLTLSLQR
jgi:hypothetical protein